MQDHVMFGGRRQADHINVVCTGYDRTGQAVEFELDAATFRTNSRRQNAWAGEVEAVERIMQRYIRAGVDPDTAWRIAEIGLPDDLHVGTGSVSWPVEQRVADVRDELLDRLDDVARQTVDGDR